MLWNPFLIKKMTEKWNLWVYKQYIYALFTVDLVKLYSWNKKKKKKSQKAATYNSNPNSLLTFGVRIFESPVSLIKEKTRPVV